MGRRLPGIALAVFLALPCAAGAQPSRDSEDWADSPEAYFLTSEERVEWKALDSRDSRDSFKLRYWLKRDPTPGTEKNEFRDLVLGRIKVADQRFPIEKTPGSRTARGYVFVVFGSPARVRDSHATAPTAPRRGTLTGPLEGTETLSLWTYDKDRTPRILEALGRPSLEIEIMIEPNRHTDSVQSPGLVNDLREKIARLSIVNPDLIPGGPTESAPSLEASAPAPAAPPEVSAAPAPVLNAALPRTALDAGQRKLLEEAPRTNRSGDAVFGDAVLWRDTGGPETLVWFSLPPVAPGSGKRVLHGLIRRENGGEEVASLSEPALPSDAFSTATPGDVILRRLVLPPGSYDMAFGVTEGGGTRTVASAAASITVPDLSAGFAVSSLLLSRGQGTRDQADPSAPFGVGAALLPPGADATFSQEENLWFFLEVANAPDPAKVTLETRLRRGSGTISQRAPFPAKLDSFAPGRSFCGFGMPLKGLSPGDYRLYVMVRDGVSPADKYVLRSADFRLKP
jgi:GWxTD domain-containing protein